MTTSRWRRGCLGRTTWSYEGSLDERPATAFRSNAAGQTNSGLSCTYQKTDINGPPDLETEGQYLRLDGTGLRLYQRYLGTNGFNLYEVAPGSGIRLLPATVEIGVRYTYAGTLNGSGASGQTFTDVFSGSFTIVGEETVGTRAGTFRAMRVDRTGSEVVTTGVGPGQMQITSQTSETQWLVLGFGLVRMQRHESGTSLSTGPFEETVEFGLVSSPQLDAKRGFWLEGRGLAIGQGDDSQTVADGTNYGGIDLAGVTKTRVFVVGNSGTGTLSISSIEIDGANAGEFTLVRVPATTLAPGRSTPFSVRFDPSGTGFRYATVSVYSSDPLASPFVFTIRGNGLAFGVIHVQRADKLVPVANGAATGTLATGTSIGRTTAAGATFIERTFVITNMGLGTLNLTGTPRVRIEGSGSAGFTIVGPGVSTLAPGASKTFVVHFDPLAVGGYFASVFIPNSDHWAPEFSFAIVGTGK